MTLPDWPGWIAKLTCQGRAVTFPMDRVSSGLGIELLPLLGEGEQWPGKNCFLPWKEGEQLPGKNCFLHPREGEQLPVENCFLSREEGEQLTEES